MAAENDIVSGLDISSLASVSQTQLLQMINQAAPLVNRGGIIFMSGAAAALPDIAANPRFSRYIWLDTQTDPPTPKIYNAGAGTWGSLVVGAGSITNAEISAAAAIAITKLAFGTARYIVRTNAAGNALEFVNPNSIFTTNDVPLSALDSSAAAAGKTYLQRNASSGITSFQPVAFADFAAGDLIAVNKITPGTNGYVLGTVAGAVTWATIESLITTLDYTKITGATGAYQVIRRNAGNTANEWASIPFARYTRALSAATLMAAGATQNIAHGGGGTVRPIFVQLFLLNEIADLSYLVGDEVPSSCCFVSTTGAPTFTYTWDTTNVVVRRNGVGNVMLLEKATGVETAVGALADWRLIAYSYFNS